MPEYLYEHEGNGCKLGKQFTEIQSIKEDSLTICPNCGKEIYRIVANTYVSTPTGDSELKSKGFAKLVRRDKGIYENVTAQDHESKIWDASKPETMPDIKGRIRD